MKYYCLGLFLFTSVYLFSQNKQDYQWLFGHESEPEEGVESYWFDFNENEHPDSMRGRHPISFAGLNASISDKDGNLIFYSNGCYVVDSQHQIMPNGMDLNNEDYFRTLADTCIAYLGNQDILILPDPGNENGYYILHKAIMPHDSSRYVELRYSYVDMTVNNGNVVDKNLVLSDSMRILSSYLTAIKHTNQKDWWILQPVENKNDYLTIILSENGFSENRIQRVGPEFHWNASASGTAVFSPDGTKYAFYNKDDNLLLFDFDRETGYLSNLKKLTLKTNTPNAGYVSSVEFSPNSRFAFIAVQDSLWQVDTYENDLIDGLELIDVWDGTQDPFATTFTLMALAPNCKIYMASGSSTNTYHVINNPNEKGKACDFVQRGIKLPYTSSFGNMPNLPRFRVDDEEKCDPTITSVFGQDVFYRRDLSIYPNPVRDIVTVEVPDGQKGHLYLFHMQGQLIWEAKSQGFQTKYQFDLGHIPSGIYSMEFVPDDNKERLLWTSQLVKVE